MEEIIQAEFEPLSDCALVTRFGRQLDERIFEHVRQLVHRLKLHPLGGITETVPSYSAVTVYFDPLEIGYDDLLLHIKRLLAENAVHKPQPPRLVEIPLCYGGDYGPDLQEVARINGLTAEEVIEIHSSAVYTVFMIGFAPGFPYMGGMSQRIAAPRKAVPRTCIPAGSVGIAGLQTGIYPLDSPGGWQIIGQTPLRLFDPRNHPPSLLGAGDKIRFRAIAADRFIQQKGESRHES